MSSIDFVLSAFKLLSAADKQGALLQMMSEVSGTPIAPTKGKKGTKKPKVESTEPKEPRPWNTAVATVLEDMLANGWEEHETKSDEKKGVESKPRPASDRQEITATKKTETHNKGDVYEAFVFPDSSKEPTYKDAMTYASWLKSHGRLELPTSKPASKASSVKSDAVEEEVEETPAPAPAPAKKSVPKKSAK
jgi:hypothetical protein